MLLFARLPRRLCELWSYVYLTSHAVAFPDMQHYADILLANQDPVYGGGLRNAIAAMAVLTSSTTPASASMGTAGKQGHPMAALLLHVKKFGSFPVLRGSTGSVTGAASRR